MASGLGFVVNNPEFRLWRIAILFSHRRWMKVNESELNVNGGRCDFCQIEKSKFTINGGLWWICEKCMIEHYGVEEE